MQKHPPDLSESEQLPEEDFEYRALPGPDYVRVLTILPSYWFGDPIQCEIETAPLNKSANYVALSYSWGMDKTGDATPNRILSIHNRTKRITQNLYEGLLRLRQDSMLQPLRIWIDAVCIDQNNDEERTHQVSNMRFVFQNANHTIVWLGEGDNPDADAAVLPVVQCITAGDSSHHKNGTHSWNRADGRKPSICFLSPLVRMKRGSRSLQQFERDLVKYLEREGVLDLAQEVLSTAFKILERRYFTRRWVVQELVSSYKARVRVYWGPHNWGMGDLLDSLNRLEVFATSMPECPVTGSFIQNSIRLNAMRKLLSSSEVHTLPKLLQICDEMECSDPRDLLFCLAGLDPGFGLVPDYHISTAAAYILFARLLFEKGYVDRLLRYAPHNRRRRLHPNIELPSWMPDLRSYITFTRGRDFDSHTVQSLNSNVSEDDILTFSPFLVGRVRSALVPDKQIYQSLVSIKVKCKQIKGAVAPTPSPVAQTTSNSSTLTKKERSTGTNVLRKQGKSILANMAQHSFTADLFRKSWRDQEPVMPGDILCSLSKAIKEEDNHLYVLRPVDKAEATFRLIDTVTFRSLGGGVFASHYTCGDVPWQLERTTVHIV